MSKPELAVESTQTPVPPVPLNVETIDLDYGFLADLT